MTIEEKAEEYVNKILENNPVNDDGYKEVCRSNVKEAYIAGAKETIKELQEENKTLQQKYLKLMLQIFGFVLGLILGKYICVKFNLF